MTIAIINTDMNIGPFKIPGNGQNMILNNYAERNKIIVEEIIPEPFMSNALATTQWVHKKKKLKKVILCSIHQLPQEKERIDDLIGKPAYKEWSKYISNVATQVGYKFLNFLGAEDAIDSTKTTWSELYKLKQKNE